MSVHAENAVVDRFFGAIRSAARTDLGMELSAGTTIVASPDRDGSMVAVAYPFGRETIVWCSHQLRPRLEPLDGRPAMTADEFVTATTELGGRYVGAGNNRVLTRAPRLSVHAQRIVGLNRDDPGHRGMIERLIDDCSDVDLIEADLHIDKLDAVIVAALDGSGEIASIASVRPWFFDHDFDDVAVITHPAHRGQGLGVATVAALSQQQQQDGQMVIYNCDVANVWSNRVATAVGFRLVNTAIAVSFV